MIITPWEFFGASSVLLGPNSLTVIEDCHSLVLTERDGVLFAQIWAAGMAGLV